jgi:arylsulfatase A-like enzyme
MKRYLSCVAAVDDNVGRLLAFLDQAGLAEDTIVIYTSDQGFFLGEHGFYDKRFMYEPCLTTPLIVRYPPLTKAGAVHESMVLNIDHAPTFLDLAGVDIPKDMQGRSYKALLSGGEPPGWRTSMYYRYWMHLDGSHNVHAQYGVRTPRYTLIHFYGKGLAMKGAKDIDTEPEWELFDRVKDPQQMRNLYDDPAHATTVRELRAELDRLRKELQDER